MCEPRGGGRVIGFRARLTGIALMTVRPIGLLVESNLCPAKLKFLTRSPTCF
jgi:hypothetical protein